MEINLPAPPLGMLGGVYFCNQRQHFGVCRGAGEFTYVVCCLAQGGVLIGRILFEGVLFSITAQLSPGGSSFGRDSRPLVLSAFMAVSPGYTIFTGVVELFGAVLLVFRGTTLVGTIVLAGALGNLMAMDVAYRVGTLTYPNRGPWYVHRFEDDVINLLRCHSSIRSGSSTIPQHYRP